MKKMNTHTALLGSLLAVLSAASFSVQAQEVGRVISSTPIIQQVAVPRQVCNNEQVVSPGQKSGAGAAMGAIAGGAIGNSMGQGSGRAAATMLGLFGGAILGDKVEGNAPPEVRNVQTCTQQMFYENRTMAYNVVYEFAGKQYTVQMPSDPGPTVRLQITPMAPSPSQNYGNVPPPGSAPRY
ncbi:glycine zipper 2TM domain-containing protein [Limnohabitans sp.]|uniref:glycine zipper 2TM domain-containing protein n=1 Tax=Limnohabitans sp. TaxID=1907725 RepID=UPI0038B7EA62